MSDDIAYQNKDIEFKLLSDVYKEKSFEVYGLKIPRIKEVLPTNLPTVFANEKHMDNLFLLLGKIKYVDINKKQQPFEKLSFDASDNAGIIEGNKVGNKNK